MTLWKAFRLRRICGNANSPLIQTFLREGESHTHIRFVTLILCLQASSTSFSSPLLTWSTGFSTFSESVKKSDLQFECLYVEKAKGSHVSDLYSTQRHVRGYLGLSNDSGPTWTRVWINPADGIHSRLWKHFWQFSYRCFGDNMLQFDLFSKQESRADFHARVKEPQPIRI